MLVDRQAARTERTTESRAERLRDQNVVETAVIERFDGANGEQRTDEYGELNDEVVCVMLMTAARTTETERVLPSVATAVANSSVLRDPIGRNPAVTGIFSNLATDHVEPSADASLLLVGLGSSSLPRQRRAVEYHQRRLAARTDFGDVTAAYLLQNPAIECAPYDAASDDVVAVPVVVTPPEVTREAIPNRLDPDHTDIAYTDLLDAYPQLTDVIRAELTEQHVFESRTAESRSAAIEGVVDDSARLVATDGRGSPGRGYPISDSTPALKQRAGVAAFANGALRSATPRAWTANPTPRFPFRGD
jgi:sirohydrochlorin ferrochelatase